MGWLGDKPVVSLTHEFSRAEAIEAEGAEEDIARKAFMEYAESRGYTVLPPLEVERVEYDGFTSTYRVTITARVDR